MRLYDTVKREVVPFEAGPTVTLYTCGITPYDATHAGHASTFLIYDVLQRRLRDLGHETRLVRNITDIDDPLFERADKVGVHFMDLAATETARFEADMIALGMLPVWSQPTATSAVTEIQQFISALLDSGHAYVAGGSVYFDITTTSRFGALSGYDETTMLDLAATNGGNVDDPFKRRPLDFVLWQSSDVGQPAWDSPWGSGRPGWHVECSVLSMREFGATIDIHGGGTDLIFPHHECEAAQSEAATGKPFVRQWVHAPMVNLDGHKMSKSRGNLVFVSELLETWEPMAIRMTVLAQSYRDEWDWDDELLAAAARRLDQWRGAGVGRAALDDVRDRLDDDLDLPGAVAAIDAAVASGQGVSEAAALLGVDLSPPSSS